jgi:hypothetical protein
MQDCTPLAILQFAHIFTCAPQQGGKARQMATGGCQVQCRLAATVLECGTRPPAHQQLNTLLMPMHHLQQTTVLPTHHSPGLRILLCIITVARAYGSEQCRMLILVDKIRVGTILQQHHDTITVTC